MENAFRTIPLAVLVVLCAASGCRRRPAEEQFKYDLGELAKTDAALVLYDEGPSIPLTLEAPSGLAIDEDDRIYICGSNAVHVLSPTGRGLGQYALPAPARCIAVGEDHVSYVGVGDHIVVLDTNGVVRATWDAVNETSYLTSLAVMDETVFAADAGNRLVLRYRLNGERFGEFTGRDDDTGTKGFVVPSPFFDVAPGRGGSLWIVNPGRQSVQEYAMDGKVVTQWGRASMQIEGFCGCCNPSHLALRSDGSFVTAEKGLTRVKEYSPAGVFTGVVAGPESFAPTALIRDLAVDSQGRVLVLDTHMPAVRIFERRKP